MLDRTIAPPIKDAVSFNYHLPPCDEAICHNGLPVYWLSAGTQDVIQIDWIFEAGLWEEPKTGVARATGALLKNGAGTKNALQINEALEYYGASLTTAVTNDFTIVTLQTLTRHLETLLPVIRDIILFPSFPEKEVAIYRQHALQRLAVRMQKTDFVANREIDAALFGTTHPYGRITHPDDLSGLKKSDLTDFHAAYYTSANCKIFVAGKIATREVGLITDCFGSEPWGGAKDQPPVPDFSFHPAADRKQRKQITEQKVQGSIRLIRDFPGRHHPDFAPMVILNTIFGGYFGSRLMANIREEKGYTYGIYSHIYGYRRAAALMIATEAGASVCEAAIEEIYREMTRLCTEPIPEQELALVKNYLLGNILGGLDGPFSLIQRWKSIILHRLPNDHFSRSIDVYKNVDADTLKHLAQKYLDPADYHELVVL